MGRMISDAASPRRFVVRTLVPGAVLVLAATAMGVVILARGNDPLPVDAAWNALMTAWASPLLTVFSEFMNAVGGGWLGTLVIPIAATLALIVARRPWWAAYFLTAEALSAARVQVFKQSFARARPGDIAVVSDFGSFPSGHVANAATIAAALAVLMPRLWVIVVGAAWVVLMAFSRTYLHAHWLTDTLGGALIGVGAALSIAAAFAVPLSRRVARLSP